MRLKKRTITAIIDTPQKAQQVAVDLEQEGFPPDSINVMSAEPIHSFTAGFDSRSPGRAGLLSIAGGFAGAVAAIALTVWTSRRMGLVTGGMPIFTPWAFGIIVYELIALGAILVTFVTTVFEAGLLRGGPSPEIDSAIADGKVAMSLICLDDTRRRVAETVFSKFGAVIH